MHIFSCRSTRDSTAHFMLPRTLQEHANQRRTPLRLEAKGKHTRPAEETTNRAGSATPCSEAAAEREGTDEANPLDARGRQDGAPEHEDQ